MLLFKVPSTTAVGIFRLNSNPAVVIAVFVEVLAKLAQPQSELNHVKGKQIRENK